MEQGLVIKPLTEEYTESWIDLHHSVYTKYPWPKPITREDVIKVLDSKDIYPFVALAEGHPVGIGLIEDRPATHKTSLESLAFDQTAIPHIKPFIKYLIDFAKQLGAISINTWIWDSEKEVQQTLLDMGFKIEVQESLIVAKVSEIANQESTDGLVIRSLSDGIPIHDFVVANQEAFKEDSSRPLEESELREWIDEEKGFHPDLQLAGIINDAIVGTTQSEMFTFESLSGPKKCAWIHGLGVIKRFRRKRIAGTLVYELANRMKAQSVTELWLFTDVEGPIRDFYDGIGFQQGVNWLDMTLHFDSD